MHNAQKKPEGRLTNVVMDTISREPPKASRKQLAASADFITRAELVRRVGVRALGIDNIKVWGEWKPEPTQRDNGDPARQEIVPRLRQNSAIVLLNDGGVDSLRDPDLLFVGYGDTAAGYGAGPTRDLRRATYAPRLLAVLPEVTLATKAMLSFKPTPLVRQLAARIDEIDKEKTADLYAINFSLERNGPFSTHINGDVVIVLNHAYISGHAFLTRNVRQTSPLYGNLESVGVSIDGCGKALRGWIDDSLGTLKEALGRMLPAGHKPELVPIVTIDNT